MQSTVEVQQSVQAPTRPHYPEQYAQTDNFDQTQFQSNYSRNQQHFKILHDSNITPSCTVGYLQGGCESGHRYLKTIYCGREYCTNCGQDGSPTHERRMARWFPKVAQMESVGYLIITIPESNREAFKDITKLNDFRTYIRRKLQRMGFKRGLMRFHWFGECHACKGKGCDTCKGTGAGRKWNPHLNVFIEARYLPISKLDEIKRSVKSYFKRVSGREVGKNVHYSYAETPEHKTHKLKYVTRSTFRLYNREIADLLKGYRSTSRWGKWEKGKAPLKSELVCIESGHCPDCLKEQGSFEKLSWYAGYYETNPETKEKKFKRELLKRRELISENLSISHVASGYFRVDPVEDGISGLCKVLEVFPRSENPSLEIEIDIEIYNN